MPIVAVDGIGNISFPDEMSEDAINGAIRDQLSSAREAGLKFATEQAPGMMLRAANMTRTGLGVQDQMQQEEADQARLDKARSLVIGGKDLGRFPESETPSAIGLNDVVAPVGKALTGAGRALYAAAVDNAQDFLTSPSARRASYTQPPDAGEPPSNLQAVLSGEEMPAVYQRRVLSKPAQALAAGGQGLIESAPRMAAAAGLAATGVSAPAAAALAFGTTDEGFDPKQAAIAAILPAVGKYAGRAVEAIAYKSGISGDAALNLFNKLGGAAGATGLLTADQIYQISQLSEDKRKDAWIDAIGNAATMLPVMALGEHETQSERGGRRLGRMLNETDMQTPAEVGAAEALRQQGNTRISAPMLFASPEQTADFVRQGIPVSRTIEENRVAPEAAQSQPTYPPSRLQTRPPGYQAEAPIPFTEQPITEGAQNAKAIRGNQGQLPESGPPVEGGEAASRNDLQSFKSEQPESVVQGEAPSAPEVKPQTPEEIKAEALAAKSKAQSDAINRGLAPEQVKITVNRPTLPDGTEVGSYAQVDGIEDGKNTFSSNPENFNQAGAKFKVPPSADLLKLPQGQYTLPEALAKLDELRTRSETKPNVTETQPVGNETPASEAAQNGTATETAPAAVNPEGVTIPGQGGESAAGKAGRTAINPPSFFKGITDPIKRTFQSVVDFLKQDRLDHETSPDSAAPTRRRLIADLVDRVIGPRSAETVDAASRQIAGESVPKTMAASPESGNAMVRFASAQLAAPHIARSLTREVLGDNWNNEAFRNRLGAVLVEDRLRAIRQGFEKAGDTEKAANVNSLVGKGKPFATEADFQAALKDKDIQDAIARHKETVQAEAQKFHTAIEGDLAGPGVNTGAFVNLQAVFEDSPETVFRGSAKGDYTRPFKRKSVFSQRAEGTAANYATDYSDLAERMIRGNFEEYTKRQLYDQLVKDGLAVVQSPGQPRPMFDGKPAVKFQIVRRGRDTQNLWVRPDIATELRSAENLDGPIRGAALTRVSNALNAIQLAGPTDAVWHVANMMSSIASAQGGKNVLVDLARKMPLANVVDATVRVGLAARKVLQNDPEVLKTLSELSQIGAVRGDRAGGGINSRIINLLDQAGRVVRNDLYDNLVKRGLITASEEGRREWVNQMGQYNQRLMGQFQSFFKEAGLSPFIVAGRNFNRQAMRRVTLSPGIRAANLQSAVQMRAVEGVGVLATLVAVPAVMNAILTGKPGGRPGTPFGAIDTGKDDKNGKMIVVDPAQWIGLRRGMRMTGINAAVEGLRRGEPTREIEKNMGRDIIGSAVHPWAGPAVQAPVIAATGQTTGFRKESKDPGDYWENFKAALANINPLLHGWVNKQKPGIAPGVESSVASLSGAAGIKTATPLSASSQINNMAHSWLEKSADPKLKAKFEEQQKQDFGESDYKGLKSALRDQDYDTAAEELRKLVEVKGKKLSDVSKYMRPTGEDYITPKPVPGLSTAQSQKFLRSLPPEQRKIWDAAKKERKDLYERYQKLRKEIRTYDQPQLDTPA